MYKHNTRAIEEAKKWRDIFAILFIVTLASCAGYAWKQLTRPLSPCQVSGCAVTKVEAAEIEEKIALKAELHSLKEQLNEYTKESLANYTRDIYNAWEKDGPQAQFAALHIAKGESGLNPKAVGYNCMYGQVSAACNKEDIGKHWSVDCGLFQVNVVSKSCPSSLFDPKTNINKARSMYERRGFQPWVQAKKLGYVK